MRLEFIKRHEEPEIWLLPNRRIAARGEIRNALLVSGLIVLFFCLLLIEGRAENHKKLIEFCGSIIFSFVFIKFFVVNKGIDNAKMRTFLRGFQSGRNIRMEIGPSFLTIDIGGETEKLDLNELKHIEIQDNYIIFEKERQVKAYIPKRACTDRQWDDLLKLFRESKEDAANAVPSP